METTKMGEPPEKRIRGWGIDRDIRKRPGYPLYQQYRASHDTLNGRSPATDTVPLKGLSGLIRRAAYRLPDWKPRRWLLLMLADRVQVLESRPDALVLGGLGGLFALGRLVERYRRRG